MQGMGPNHPTQALLNVSCSKRFDLKDKNILFIGAFIKAASLGSTANCSRLGARIGVVGPEHFAAGLESSIQVMQRSEEGLAWADVVMGLRVQFERHSSANAFHGRISSVVSITRDHGAHMKPGALLMHPARWWGVEFDPAFANYRTKNVGPKVSLCARHFSR